MRGWVAGVMQVQRLDQAPAEHHMPESVCDILPEGRIVPLGKSFRQFESPAVFRNRADVLVLVVRGDGPHLCGSDHWFGDLRAADQSRLRPAAEFRED